MKCLVFQRNTDWLPNKSAKKIIFAQDTLHLSFFPKEEFHTLIGFQISWQMVKLIIREFTHELIHWRHHTLTTVNKCYIYNSEGNIAKNKKIITQEIQYEINSEYKHFIFRSSHQRCSLEKGVLWTFTKFTGKHLYQSLFFSKVEGLLLHIHINIIFILYSYFSC